MVILKHNSLNPEIFFNAIFFPYFSGSMFFRVQVFQSSCFSGSRFFRVQVFQGPDYSGSRFFRVRVQVLEVARAFRFFRNIRYLGIQIYWFGKKESILVSQAGKISKVFWVIFWTDSNLFLIEFRFNCPKNKCLGCFDLTFFKKGKEIFSSLSWLWLTSFRIWFSFRNIFK